MDKKGEKRKKKKRLDKKERTTKKKNGLLRVLSPPPPPKLAVHKPGQSKPPLNGTPRQTGLVARRTSQAAGLKNGRQPRVRATPYWPHHSNRGDGKGGRGRELAEEEKLSLLGAARLFEDDPGSLPTATPKGPTHHSSLPGSNTCQPLPPPTDSLHYTRCGGHILQQCQGQQA